MSRRALWIGGACAIAVLAAAGTAGGYAYTHAAEWIGNRLASATGRETRIGSVDIDWAWTPTVRLTDVAVGNADWAEADYLLTAGEVRFRLRLIPLLRGALELPDLAILDGSLAIERNADGRSNWSFSSAPAAASAVEAVDPEERDEVPLVGRLRITDGRLTLRDAMRGLALDGTVSTATGEAEGRLELSLKGTLGGEPLAARMVGGSVLMLRDGERPYPVEFDIAFGETSLHLKGTLADPIAFEGADVVMAIEGPDFAEVFPLLGIPAPPTPPYAVKGHLRRDGELWRLEGMSGRIGDSDVSGDVAVDYRPKVPMLTAELVSTHLDFDDLAPLIGAPPEVGSGETASDAQRRQFQRMREQDQLFPDVPLKVERLRSMDMDVRLTSNKIESRAFLPVTSLDVRVRVASGRAEANPLKFGVAGGIVQGSMALNARSEVPSADADLSFEGLELAAFFKDSTYYETMGGTLQGRVYLLGSGHSLAEVMRTADGDAAVAMTGGAISGLLVEGAGLDLLEALILVIGEDAKVPIRCAMSRLTLREGRALIERGVMDTSDSVLYFTGSANLQEQTLKIDIEADAKDFSLLDIDAPVHLEGKIRDPDISIGKGSPIPFLELGDGEDVPCGPLIDEYLKPRKRS